MQGVAKDDRGEAPVHRWEKKSVIVDEDAIRNSEDQQPLPVFFPNARAFDETLERKSLYLPKPGTQELSTLGVLQINFWLVEKLPSDNFDYLEKHIPLVT